MQYNWYPGHMAKARRQLVEQLSNVDVVIEIADARIPYASRNPDLQALAGKKPRVLLLNKADLADEAATRQWLEYYRANDQPALAITATNKKAAQKAAEAVRRAASEAVAHSAARGIRKVVRGLVVGIPNCGKSTLINSLYGSVIARAADQPGVTRGRQWVKIDPYFELMDTPGLLWPRIDDEAAGMRLALVGSMRDDALDVELTARALLEVIHTQHPGLIARLYNNVDETLGQDFLLEAICAKKGWLLSQARPDTLRGARMLLDAFRGGKWGRLTLDPLPGQLPGTSQP